MDLSDNIVARRALDELSRRLPAGWRVQERAAGSNGTRLGDLAAVVIAPDRRKARLLIEAKRRIDPRTVIDLARQLEREEGTVIVASRFLSSAVRERLEEAGFGYVDLTGNVRVVLDQPGLYIRTTGAVRNPNREPGPARTLKGPKAGRIVRALCDFRGPLGVRDLAARAGVDAGYASRLLAVLDREAVLERGPRGRIVRVDWRRLIQKWATEAPLSSRGREESFLEPRGLPSLLERLRRTQEIRHAVSGSMAAARLAPVAASRLALVYVDDIDRATDVLDLRPADAGANVILIEPTDAIVFERAKIEKKVSYAAPSQVAADLLTSPGRGPAEAEELMNWMAKNEEDWRG